MVRVALLWHMHQPVYRHPRTHRPELPWVRLHALKDYLGIARVLKEFPEVRTTVNLVPSLVEQIEECLAGAQDAFQEISQKPAAELDDRDQAFMIRHFFSASHGNMILPHDRYAELLARREEARSGSGLTISELRDLQVWSTLTWFDVDWRRENRELQYLMEKGRNFSEADKRIMEGAQSHLLERIIPAWRELSEAGGVEISTSPFTHSILPILMDPQVGRVANPQLPPYKLDFHWIEDARHHLESALDFMEIRFGKRPRGIWPSEGSLSEAVVTLMEDLGVRWTASDEINLARSLNRDGDPHWGGRRDAQLYHPWTLRDSRIRLFFRDHDLSDRIGFQYQSMDPDQAAEDFISRLHEIAESSGTPVVPVILDGENPWEHFSGDGRPFLRALLGRLQADPGIEAVTMSEAAEMDAQRLNTLAPGSWIGGNFDIWIGDESDRRGWELVRKARECFEASRERLSADQIRELRKCLDVAQGSDWFWWFGPEHHTADLDLFDRLFRLNLQRIYEVTGCEPPEDLFRPVCADTPPGAEPVSSPKGILNPTLDGRETHFFEWLGAGQLNIHSGRGAMDSGESVVTGLRYGFGPGRFFLRIDTKGRADTYFPGGKGLRIGFRRSGGKVRTLELPPPIEYGEVAIGAVVECGLNLESLGFGIGDLFEFYLERRQGERTAQLLPFDGFFPVIVPADENYVNDWIV